MKLFCILKIFYISVFISIFIFLFSLVSCSGAMKKIALSTYCTKEGWTGFELYIYDDDGNRHCVYPYNNMYHCCLLYTSDAADDVIDV